MDALPDFNCRILINVFASFKSEASSTAFRLSHSLTNHLSYWSAPVPKPLPGDSFCWRWEKLQKEEPLLRTLVLTLLPPLNFNNWKCSSFVKPYVHFWQLFWVLGKMAVSGSYFSIHCVTGACPLHLWRPTQSFHALLDRVHLPE